MEEINLPKLQKFIYYFNLPPMKQIQIYFNLIFTVYRQYHEKITKAKTNKKKKRKIFNKTKINPVIKKKRNTSLKKIISLMEKFAKN